MCPLFDVPKKGQYLLSWMPRAAFLAWLSYVCRLKLMTMSSSSAGVLSFCMRFPELQCVELSIAQCVYLLDIKCPFSVSLSALDASSPHVTRIAFQTSVSVRGCYERGSYFCILCFWIFLQFTGWSCDSGVSVHACVCLEMQQARWIVCRWMEERASCLHICFSRRWPRGPTYLGPSAGSASHQ